MVDLWLAPKYLPRRLPLDYGLDGLIEAIVDGHPSGRMVFFQQKGTRGLEFNDNGRASWPMETIHLRAYRDITPLPVFLLLVDVEAGAGWYCDLWPEIERLGDNVDENKSATVWVRLDSMIRDLDGLLAAMDRAIADFRERNPGSLQAAFRAEARAHESIDPNFKVVKAEVSANGTCFTIAPAREFSFNISVPGGSTEAAEKIRDLVNFGRPLKLTTNEANFQGLPFFEWAKSKGFVGALSFRPEKMYDCQVAFSAGPPDQLTFTVPGKVSAGASGIAIEAALPKAPLSLSLRIDRRDIEQGAKRVGTLNLSWDLDAWKGAELKRLPWIRQITALWRKLFAMQRVDIEFLIDGNCITNGSFGDHRPGPVFETYHALCEMLLKAHELASDCDLAFKVPSIEELEDFEWANVDAAHALHFNRTYESPAPNAKWQFTLTDKSRLEALRAKGLPASGWGKFVHESYGLRMFGDVFWVRDVVCEVGPITWREVSGQGDSCMEMIGDETTRITLSRVAAPRI